MSCATVYGAVHMCTACGQQKRGSAWLLGQQDLLNLGSRQRCDTRCEGGIMHYFGSNMQEPCCGDCHMWR
jgi:hypothetical protein